MQEKLIVNLAWNEVAPSFLIVDAEGNKQQGKAGAETLSAHAFERDVIVIVPAEDVLLTSVQLPKMNRTRLLAALPYALEEQLIDDVESLHFAIADQQMEDGLPVAIVSHAKMQHWLSVMSQLGVTANAFIPFSLALPIEEDVWHAAVTRLVTVRTNKFNGFASDSVNFASLLDLAMQSLKAPRLIHLHNYTNEPLNLSVDELLQVKEDMLLSEQINLEVAETIHKTPCINLLQGRYAVKKSAFPQKNKLKRVLTYLSVAFITLFCLYPIVSYFILKQRVNQLDQQIAQIYKRQFPQSNSIIAPKLRLEEKLHKIEAQTGETRLLLLLAYLGRCLQEKEGVKLKRFDFQGGQLTVEMTALNPESFSVFTEDLMKQGLSVKQQNANLNGERVNATLLIE